ncbi:MAG: gluconate 2-dehydrogenase subunit 3 family protein [Flavobacteriaceae bacterium]|nr:gluconate 2-dehydrogenase subunit 3 family protein [Flavobacteriaceae bacterium]
MDRRRALKGIGLSLGFMVATPTVLGILHSCQKDPDILWTPKFFTEDEGIVIQNLTDLILPSTMNSPGAIDMDVPQFLDIYFKEVESSIKQNYFKKGVQYIIKELGNNVSRIHKNDYDNLLAKYLKASKEEIEEIKNNKKDNHIFGTLRRLRDYSIWAFLTSEKIGKDHLAYDPVPGIQIGCISVEEATGGKKWSL